MDFWKKRVGEKVQTALFDLTHLEINTIVKEEMDGTKSPSSPRLLLHELSKRYDEKLIALGKKYVEYFGSLKNGDTNLFRGRESWKQKGNSEQYFGSGYKSFREFAKKSERAVNMINGGKADIPISEEDVDADIKMLKRIQIISDEIRSMLNIEGVDKNKGTEFDFDKHDTVEKFRVLPYKEALQHELNLDLRQYMVIKKATDIGVERILMQTIIGMDGDVTTRISKSMVDKPISIINEMHHEAIQISVNFWNTLVSIIVDLGKSIFEFAVKK